MPSPRTPSRRAPARLAALVLLALPARARQEPEPAAPRPRLAVIVVVDQLVPDQLVRLGPWLRGGLGRFAQQGLSFQGEHRHACTETGPGHATLSTGMHPAHHGIVANDWWQDDSGKHVYCAADPAVRGLGAAGGEDHGENRFSPHRLRADGIADHLRRADPQSRVVSISGKDRAAILAAGRHPDWALWWDQDRGGFASSTWYGPELPDWVRAWNRGWLARFRASPLGEGWKLELPEDFAASRTAPDERKGEIGMFGRHTFPYAVPELSDPPEEKQLARLAKFVFGTAAGDQMVIDLGRAALDGAGLGADEHVDLLLLGLSSCDVVGHACGPDSCEVTDLLLRTDRALGELFDLLDRRLGAERWIAALSADHGVLDLPETLVARGEHARRFAGTRFAQALQVVRTRHEEQWGEDFVAASDPQGLRLDRARIAAADLDLTAVREALASDLAETCFDWCDAAWSWDRIEAATRAGAEVPELLRLEANAFDPERTPDVVLVAKPMVLVGMPFGTTHGSPYDYDRRVPLVFLGPGFPAGQGGPAATVDLLPTLLAHLGIPVPEGLDGRVLGAE